MLRRSAASVVPLAIRVVGSQRLKMFQMTSTARPCAPIAPLRRRFYAAAPRHRGGRLRSPPLVASDLRFCNHSAPPLHHCSTPLPRATARPLLRNRAAAPPRREPSKP
ncbi:hypothetical protein U1Q18_004824 [Sarracenia purpurea var. burkii]